MVIPAPIEVDALMKQVPSGKVVTTNELRAALAKTHKVDFACPMTTGIFSWIAAHPAAEAEADGVTKITPFWRTLKTGGEVNPKYPGGVWQKFRKDCVPRDINSFQRAPGQWWPTTRKRFSPD
jgi:hypothetical protein